MNRQQLVALTALLHTLCASAAPCALTDHPDDCHALIALFNTTAAAGTRLNWPVDGGTSLCGWQGLTCENGRAATLILSGLFLRGTVPEELSSLGELRKLWLDYNSLSGTVPPLLGRLANLTDLWLPFNAYSGTIPPQLSTLASVQTLFLYQAHVSGTIPSQLARLRSLQQLDLTVSNLSGTIPTQLGNHQRWTSGSIARADAALLTSVFAPPLEQLLCLRSSNSTRGRGG
jgi:hypothetical protein